MKEGVIDVPEGFSEKFIDLLKEEVNPKMEANLFSFYDHVRAGTGLKNLTLELTKKCYENCSHCYSDSGPDGKHLDYGVATELIKQAKEGFHIPFITLTGGQPFLPYPGEDMPYAVKLALDYPDLITHVYSSGNIICDKGVVDAISDTGNIIPFLSVGRSNREDEITCEVIRLLVRVGVPAGISYVLTEQNADPTKLKRVLEKFGGARFVKLNLYMPTGRADGVSPPTTEQRKEVGRFVQEEMKKGERAFIAYLLFPAAGRRWGCYAGKELIFIDSEGDFSPCPFSEKRGCYNAHDLIQGRYISDGIKNLSDLVNKDPLFIYTKQNTGGECLILDGKL